MAAANILDHYGVRDKRLVLPELSMFGWDNHTRSIPHLRPHVHARAFEVCYLVRGSVEWWCGPEVYQVNRGDIYITRPGERHGGVDSMMHPCELFFFQIRIPARTALPGLTATQTRALARGFAQLRRRCFPGSTTLLELFRHLHDAHRNPSVLASITARAALHHILVTVLDDHRRAMALRDESHSRRIAMALAWMDEHDEEPYRVEDVAAAVSLGPSRFHELFVQETGFTPSDYRARRRIAHARAMLRTSGRSITDIAFALGFSSSQYFATVFKKLTGLTPAAYRKQSVPAA